MKKTLLAVSAFFVIGCSGGQEYTTSDIRNKLKSFETIEERDALEAQVSIARLQAVDGIKFNLDGVGVGFYTFKDNSEAKKRSGIMPADKKIIYSNIAISSDDMEIAKKAVEDLKN